MLAARINELGALPYHRGPTPLKRVRRDEISEVFGLDTEYTQTGELVCFTVAGDRRREIYEPPLTVARLAEIARDFSPRCRRAVFFAFFSLAELQFFDLVAECKAARVYGRGSVDAEFLSVAGRCDVEVRDVARYFDGASLASAAKSFGLQKKTEDVTNVTRADLQRDRFREYAKHDAFLAREIFVRLRESMLSFGRGVDALLYPTAASLSAALFRQDFLDAPIELPHRRIQRLAMLCSWGGRAEAFFRGAVPDAAEFDLRSAYPSAVLDHHGFHHGAAWRQTSDRKSTRLNSSHVSESRMPSSA